jgi:hypothetical protein
MAQRNEIHSSRADLKIFLVSLGILFFELAVIRWISTEIRIFAYLQNSVLIAAFLGLGLGMHHTEKPLRIGWPALAWFALAVIVTDPLRWKIAEGISQGVGAMQGQYFWYSRVAQMSGQPYVFFSLVFTALFFSVFLIAAVAMAFFPCGQYLGRLIAEQERPLRAYTLNILGSLGGVLLFTFCSVQGAPSWSWLAASTLVLLVPVLIAPASRLKRIACLLLLAAVPLLTWWSADPRSQWSPYQKLTLLDFKLPPGQRSGFSFLDDRKMINVNNVGYQLLVNLDHKLIHQLPVSILERLKVKTSHYVMPFELLGAPDSILVVGSGAGNDVAGALAAGSRQVDAVEIDPVIVAIGRRYHPNHPYQDPRVTLHIDDARAFFHKTKKQYDMIWFGLLDSHTSNSAFTNVRLDHFVYTRESLHGAKRLLKSNGAMVVYFGFPNISVNQMFIAQRLRALLADAFGVDPLVFMVQPEAKFHLGWGGMLFVGAAPEEIAGLRLKALRDADFASTMVRFPENQPDITLTTDDWPYLYLPAPAIPSFHLIFATIFVFLAIFGRKRIFGLAGGLQIPMVLSGAAFLLLEVMAVSRAALLFGTTWMINSYIIAAVFIMTLLANWVAHRFPAMRLRWVIIGEIAGLLLNFLLAPALLAGLPWLPRLVLSGLYFACPVFFSGLIFVRLWIIAERKDLALGNNLFGALLGGLLSIFSMLIGFNRMVLLNLAIYLGIVLWIYRRHREMI